MNALAATLLLLAAMATNVHATGRKAMCRVYPDPHFRTWNKIYYDYHGGCDLVLIQNPTFDGADELDLHIRTVPQNAWGGISNAVLRIGSSTLEVVDDGSTYLDGALVPASLNGKIGVMGSGGHVVHYDYSVYGSQSSWEVALNDGQYVRFVNFNHGGRDAPDTAGSISIEVYGDVDDFGGSVGMCGTWAQPGLTARDGTTDLQASATAGVDMGEEWQVLATEAQLFHSTAGAVPAGSGCMGPYGRGPGDDPDLLALAEDSCEHLEGEEFNNCVFDIMVTGNTNWARAPFYKKYTCRAQKSEGDDYCKRTGGKCVEGKDCDDTTHFCNPKLCYTTNWSWLIALDQAAKFDFRRRTSEAGEFDARKKRDSQNNRGVRRSTPRIQVEDDPQQSDISEEAMTFVSPFRDPCICAIPRPFKSGKCCKYTGPVPYNCAGIESMTGAGIDFDGRCNAVNHGDSCNWDYTDPNCCEIAMNDANCQLPSDEAKEACECAKNKSHGGSMLGST